MTTHPCLRCGACCASFRVAFHWSEAQPVNPDGVPEALVESLRHHEVALRTDATLRCVALRGKVGEAASCSIYAQRPSPCRTLRASWEDGTPEPQCDRAREKHGLAALTLADWD